VYIAGGGDTLKVEPGDNCFGVEGSTPASRADASLNPEMADVGTSIGRDGFFTNRGRTTPEVFLSRVTMVA